MKKRLFALVLCLALVFTFAPTLALAEDTVIDTVPITIADPVAGEYPTYMSDMLEGMNYTVYQEAWENNGTGFELKAKETFELGEEYLYHVWLKPNEGYSFAYDAVATISNPVWTIDDNDVLDGMLHFQANYTVTTGENKVVKEEDRIKETLNLDLGTYNSQPGEIATTVGKEFDCDRYYVYYDEWTDATTHMVLSDTDTFEAGKLYTYEIVIKPYDEYGFTEDSQVIIDGIEWNRSNSSVAYYFDYNGSFIFKGYYTPGLESIDNVTVNIEDVEEGKPLVFVKELPENANYTISEQYWRKDMGVLPQDSIYTGIGDDYYYCIKFLANEGYRFTSNTTVTINGIEWDCLEAGVFDAEQLGDCLAAGIFADYTLREKENELTTEAITEEVTLEITTEVTTEVTTEATTEVITEATTEATIEATTAEATTEATTTAAPADIPVTGNTTKAVLWISLLCIAAAGAFVTVMAVRERKQ